MLTLKELVRESRDYPGSLILFKDFRPLFVRQISFMTVVMYFKNSKSNYFEWNCHGNRPFLTDVPDTLLSFWSYIPNPDSSCPSVNFFNSVYLRLPYNLVHFLILPRDKVLESFIIEIRRRLFTKFQPWNGFHCRWLFC